MREDCARPTRQEQLMRIISADSHVLEPHDLWTSRLAGTPFADRAPRMVEDERHGHVFAIDGFRRFPLALRGPAGKPRTSCGTPATRAGRRARGGGDPW